LQYGLLSEHKNPGRTGDAERRPIMYNVFGKNSIVFDLKDAQNQVVSLYFRSIALTKDQADGRPRHFYLKYPHAKNRHIRTP
jgi:DNA primase